MTVIDRDTDLIPVLDLTPLGAGDDTALEALAHQLRDALERVGFFFVVGHGIDWSVVDGIYATARSLHALPEATKQVAAMDGDHGGYLGLGGGTSYASEIAGAVRKPNQNAAFFVHEGGYRVANRYPDLDGLRETTADYMIRIEHLANSILPVLARSLDLPPDWFEPHFDVPSTTLRMSHYPAMDYSENEWGLAPHTDSSIFTFLPSNDVPGLEIRPAGHEWIQPPPIAESFLVNSGDMLKRWTNNRYLSTAHRVRNLSPGDRYAIPFFYGARDDAVIEAIPTCVSDERPVRHEPVTYGDYQRWFINRNYAGVTGTSVGAEFP